ncbi:hypothetical protein BZG36_03699 [Bifiguratus adelaidae]|uniref:4-hydroxybenzoate polyprenyltransferase, mitochondrial n=1 Tax=Bifiguratus adelaidae TaxID=1938954 RepID=A0A261XZ64_9FUNG|nr:hypothetical protein BZG36_03699 [Bifiguratus adelaidae]
MACATNVSRVLATGRLWHAPTQRTSAMLVFGQDPRSTVRCFSTRSLTPALLHWNKTSPMLSVFRLKHRPVLTQLLHRPSTTTSTSITTNPTTPTPPANYGTWLDKMPSSWRPYLYLMRLDKPIGTWLLYWPCAWSISMAAYGEHLSVSSAAYMMGLFGAGALIMRGAGCTINDLWDKDIDNRVERTKLRPIASGVISPKRGIAFLGLQLSAGLAILTQLNIYSIILGASSLSLVTIYPLMKRITYWPQSVLGLAFNWGALLGWSAMTGSCNWTVCLPLYLGGVSWTLVYDTIYAHQDKKDDVQVGVKSTALRFGEKTPQWLAAFSTSFVSLTALAGYMNGQGLPFYAVSVAGTAAHLAWQLRTVQYDDPKSCWRIFASHQQTGTILWSGIVLDTAYRAMMG